MSMNKIPTLILGIGGIGCRIAAHISDLLTDEDRRYVGIVGMDTNVNDLNQLQEHKMIAVQTSDERRVRDYLKKNHHLTEWFPVNRYTVDRGMLEGAGQIRAISRLAALACEEENKFAPILHEIERIRVNDGGYNKTLAVMVVGSITGGTGAGLFLQMPLYIRDKLKHSSGLESIIIRGMFMGADLTADVQPSKINRNAVRVNAYSCIKELNALYLAQSLPADRNPIKLEYYEKASLQDIKIEEREFKDDYLDFLSDEEDYLLDDDFSFDRIDNDKKVIAGKSVSIPYDYLYLLESGSSVGTIGDAELGNIEELASRMVHTLMFTPVKDKAVSVEDNFVLHDMESNGMGRYAGAGICRMVFPKEEAIKYVTLRTVEDVVRNEWTIIDRKFNDQVKEARTRQKTDGTVRIPKIEQTFPAIFTEQTGPRGTMGKLFNEAFLMVERQPVPKIKKYLGGINDLVEEVLERPDIVDAISNCQLNFMELCNPEGARKQIAFGYDGIEEYLKLAKKVIKMEPGGIANAVFPPSKESLRSAIEGEAKNTVYHYLATVHPLTARFFCYEAITYLNAKIKELEESANTNAIEAFYDFDFDGNTEQNEDAYEALAKILSGKNDKKKKKTYLAELQALATNFSDEVENAVNNISDYIRKSVQLEVYQRVLERFEMLADNYRMFFETIKKANMENADSIKKLEDFRLPYGQMGVYCSKEAFRTMASDYMQTLSEDLPEDTKEAVFLNLFNIFAVDVEDRTKEYTQSQKEELAARKKEKLAAVFNDSIFKTIRTDVIKKGADIVDLDIRKALEKEFELVTLEREDNSPDYYEHLYEYIRNAVNTALGRAAPNIAVSANAYVENTETAYIALNPKCAAQQENKPSESATKSLYVGAVSDVTNNAPVSAIIQPEFSPYEIICYRARYKFRVEDLIRYAPDSANAQAYKKRILNLGKEVANPNDPDAFKTVVNPHLNRYWHEEGFIPALFEKERKKEKMDTKKAFVFSFAIDAFSLKEQEVSHNEYEESDLLDIESPRQKKKELPLRWTANSLGVGMHSKELKSCGNAIGTGYHDLYNAMFFNGRMKARILAVTRRRYLSIKGNRDPEELVDTLCTLPLISNLYNRKNAVGENLFDVFLKMRLHMPREEWNSLFDALLEALWEICSELLDENVYMINQQTRLIIKYIYANSHTGEKDRHIKECQKKGESEQLPELTYEEKLLKEIVLSLLKKEYR